MVNLEITEWCMDPKNYEKGLFLVPCKEGKIPVSNQLCPLCDKGWNIEFGYFAVKNNKVYHLNCLKQFNMDTPDIAIDSTKP